MTSGALFPVPMVSIAALLAARPRRVVDLRSPGEYAQDHLPGALNVPLFDDLERALIGTLYVQHSPQAAFEAGRERTRAKIATFTAQLADLCGWELAARDLEERVERLTSLGIERLERELAPAPAAPAADSVVVYCWRGGLRSRSVEIGRAHV